MGKRRRTVRQANVVERFGSRLRELRQSQGLTQVELARKAKITESYVGRLERGGAAPGIDLVEKLAAALGTTLHDLVPSEDEMASVEVLRDQVRELAESVIGSADGETLKVLAGVLAGVR